MTVWTTLKNVVEHWASRELRRPYVGYVASGGGNAMTAGQTFVPEASYFGVRMVEMGLREGGKFFSSFLPLGVVLTEFSFGDGRQRRPTILSNDEIAAQLKAAGAAPGYVDFKNIYAVRRAPMKQDNLSLFVGLFRLPFHDVAQQVLQLAADLTTQTGLAPGVSEGLRVAEKIYDRVAGLFALNIVTPLFSYADGNALGRSGYLLVAGSDLDEAVAKRLVVIDDRLLLDGQRVSGLDYCLLAIEFTASLLPEGPDTINPLTQLGFHRHWQGVASSIMKRELEHADEQMLALRSEVITSPELAENDRLVAIGAYQTSYDKLVERVTPKNAHRGWQEALLADAADKATAKPAVTELLKGMQIRLLTGIKDAPDDPDKLFASEAFALRKTVGKAAPVGTDSAVSLARVINRAVTARQ
ncbi:hypothetical protein [Bradyrhizobium centrosematis]|uniref:hypothetical protein n=1 Tax=Bradyrhizobium centrosematis TaxID=1300039 RepID=UPI0021697EE8|nr:hypothetical protein [Bradyrhizobium centrosematis]MCS3759688.1 hypothetical protein [Bradyrhizobium centrosematis]MCS3772423.1 hypothetical protein [Bradyrhizobium centrosematis]